MDYANWRLFSTEIWGEPISSYCKKNMIIGFDGRYAEGDLVGIGYYINGLVSSIASMNNKCLVF